MKRAVLLAAGLMLVIGAAGSHAAGKGKHGDVEQAQAQPAVQLPSQWSVLVHPFWKRVVAVTGDGAWESPDLAPALLKGGETYRIVGYGVVESTATGNRPECPATGAARHPFSSGNADGYCSVTFAGQDKDWTWSGAAIVCPWDPVPAKVERLASEPFVEKTVKEIIADRADLNECGVYRDGELLMLKADFDADGVDEILARQRVIAQLDEKYQYATLLMVFEPEGDGWRQVIVSDIEPNFYTSGKSLAVSSVLDVDGDEKMEIVTELVRDGENRVAVSRYDGAAFVELCYHEVFWD